MLKGFKKRRLAVALGACMMMPSAAVYALGMGEVEVHSALNEPLKAQIRLLSTTAAELSALQVTLASNEAFSRMGIERTAALRDLRFGVVTQGVGAPYITILSDAPMREPFLDLILMASWSNGQLMREYTLLLDPPVFDDSQAVAPVRAAKTQSAAIDRGQKNVTSTAAVAVKSAPRTAGSYGPTTRTDTLWHVAREMRPSNSVSVPQMMMALLKENPDAFIDGNVNNLKAGHILRAPSADIINSISGSEAVAETNRHYQTWQAVDVDSSPVNQRPRQAATAAAPSAKVAPAAAVSTNARLKLLSPEDAKQPGGAGSSVQGKGTVTEQLAMALETVEATKQENVDLKARLADLERQLESVQRLLTLKGDTLSALQGGLNEPAVAAADSQAGIPVAPASTEAKVEPEAVAPETSLIDQIMANPILLAAAAGGPLLLLLMVMLIRRRRQAQLHDAEDVASVETPIGHDNIPKAAMAGGGAVVVAKPVLDEQGFGEVIDATATPDFNVVSSMSTIQAEESEIDPIAEADVYLAYRRYEQAEALLKEAIRQDSGRSELKLKLLEIYFTTKDKDAFEAQAEALYASLGGQEDDLWAQAVEMGREIAVEHPLFAEGSATPGMPGVAAVGSVALSGLGVVATSFNEGLAFEKSPSDFADEFSFDLSDDDLASSLSMSSLDGNEATEDLVELEVTEQNLISLDEVDFAAEDEFSLDADIAAIDEQLEIDDVTAQDSDESLPFTSLDEFDIDGNGFDDLISGADIDQLGEVQAVVDPIKDGVTSDGWTISPAISSFQSRDVKTEMDDGYLPVVGVANDIAGAKNIDHLSLDESVSDQQDGGLESSIFEDADDIVGTKLDLARAYIDMGDQSGARSILDEVVKEGGSSHRQEAEQLMRQIS